ACLRRLLDGTPDRDRKKWLHKARVAVVSEDSDMWVLCLPLAMRAARWEATLTMVPNGSSAGSIPARRQHKTAIRKHFRADTLRSDRALSRQALDIAMACLRRLLDGTPDRDRKKWLHKARVAVVSEDSDMW
ncbi:MAG: hypothetical protein MHM6MM_009623, partial [Cercozoa sp. M6MM]